MRQTTLSSLFAAAFIGAFGIFFVFAHQELEIGTARSMGPGYFPRLVGYLLLVSSILIALFDRSTELGHPHLRPLASVLAGIFAFALTVDTFGFVAATVLCTVLSALGDRKFSLVPSLAVGIFIAAFSWLVFRVGLGIRMSAFAVPWG